MLGCAALLGWALDVPPLRSTGATLPAMPPNTAAGLAVAGVALFVLASTQSRAPVMAARVLAALVALLGALGYVEQVFVAEVGIGARVLAGPGGLTPPQMTLSTALSFMAIGVSLWHLDTENARGRRPAQYVTTAVFFFRLLTVVGYLYDSRRSTA
jgi:hypothetical protein